MISKNFMTKKKITFNDFADVACCVCSLLSDFSFVKFLRGQVRVLCCHFSEKEIEYYDSSSLTVVDISKLTVVNFIFTKCLMPAES